jgi:hypothetical protein
LRPRGHIIREVGARHITRHHSQVPCRHRPTGKRYLTPDMVGHAKGSQLNCALRRITTVRDAQLKCKFFGTAQVAWRSVGKPKEKQFFF